MSWDPTVLLNPRGTSGSPPRPQSAAANLGPAIRSTPFSTDLSFQFSNPSDPISTDFTGLPSTAHHNPPTMPIFQNGFGQRIELLNNVQDRIAAPQPKRRKTQNEDDVQMLDSGFRGTGSGVLGDYLRHLRVDPMSKPPPPKAQETVDLTEGDSDASSLQKPAAESLKDEEVCFGMIEGASINCHKVPAPKPGMLPIGGEGYWPQVKVVLRRRVDDPTSKIFVYDHTRQVFGTVDSRTAAGLAPLLDHAMLQIRTDCRIPMRRKVDGEQVGQSISRIHKFEMMIYGPRKFALSVGKHLTRFKLNLLSPPRVDAGVKVVNPHARENRLPPPARFTPIADASSSYHAPPATVRTVEEIRSEVLGVFDSLPKSDDLPEMHPDGRVLTELLKHQRQALYFMMHREEDKIPDASDGMISSTWQRRKDRNGADLYYNVVTNQSQRERPPPALGGILADMMGLGKTLSVLSLVVTTLDDAVAWSRNDPVQPKAPERKPSHASKHFEVPKPQSVGLTELRQNGKATLLICPLSTVTNWEEQMKQHIKPGTISYHIYHGPNRVKDVVQLSQYDLVITTYGSVSSELNSRAKKKRGVYPLEEIGWFRIVLDEAHMIREQNTLAFKSICRLQASRRWAVTGTPVQNKLEDLASLLAFLRIKPFDEKAKFMQYIITPFKNADPEIVPKLRVLVDTITLRRLKDKINLPQRTDDIVRLKFTEDEQRIYDWFAKTANERVQVLTGQGIGQERILGGKTMIHILRSILQLRLICAHGKDLLNDEDLAELQGMTADTPIDIDSDDEDEKPVLQETKAYEMLYLMQEGNSDNCFKCNRKLGSSDVVDLESEGQEDSLGFMAQCFHVYCPSCITSVRGTSSRGGASGYFDSKCSVCDNINKASCVELRRSRAEVEHETRTVKSNKGGTGKLVADERYTGPHTKTRALIEDLLAAKEMSRMQPDQPPYKSVVFSGWTSHLDLIQIALDNAGITYTRLDGKMTRPARNAAMDAFRDDPTVQVILVSIMAGGLGLNLTTGNTVYVMEPQFNPAAEAQAVDRVHRLGQKRPVRTVRFIMEGSFEEKMLQLQDKKKKLASLSMDGRDKDKVMDRTEAAKQRLMDLRSLFK
ncbi:SNF2 family N-terminal domain-containing protein [Apodospora peruviana]|uniref:SNF2 family N-terminal domain-containing protein n=1 Tax=Apodospora peruviana TaxID=516989 RepID=A0AAE0I4E9_9PEZI|nr:SNF2 family N-terminal domain-containing protein [Apodospora peruviana]